MNKPIVNSLEFGVILEQICREFAENHAKELEKKQVVLVGIHHRGVPLAKRLAEILRKKYRCQVDLGRLDITLYRDDVGEIGSQPLVKETDIPCDIDGKIVLLIDDVLYTGRTIRAALDALLELGRPRLVRLAVAVDRGGRELPIQPDYYGTKINISQNERVYVQMKETDGKDGISIAKHTAKNSKLN